MIKQIERTESPAEAPAPASTWIQITFTLDPEHYRALRDRAGEEGLTVPGFVRESVIHLLREIKIASRKIKPSAKRNAGDLL